MSMIAIIPARAGSKRLPGKNIKELDGKPLLSYTIEAALAADCFDRVIVSTEDNKIATIAKEYGAEVPFLRSQALATDVATAEEAVIETLNRLKANYDSVMLLQPTSPFRSVESIHASIALFDEVKPESVVSVSPASTHPLWYKKIDNNNVMHSFYPAQSDAMRFQGLSSIYQLNGLIYISTLDNLYRKRTFYSDNTRAFITQNRMESIDIDDDYSWLLAEFVISFQKGKKL